jgi:hypothetical protein
VKTVAVLQSCYIPWKGYFDLMNRADEFIVYDDRQYTKNDWRNRNKIKTPRGSQWLTIPIARRGRHGQRIDEAEVTDSRWRTKHWKAIVQNYSRAPCFEEQSWRFEQLYATIDDDRLTVINQRFLRAVCQALGINTPVTDSKEYQAEGRGGERVLSLCRAAGATRYLSGPSARTYLDEDQFARAGIDVEYVDYSGYPEYPQLYPPFDHAVTVLDLLFNVGAAAARYMPSFDLDAATAP